MYLSKNDSNRFHLSVWTVPESCQPFKKRTFGSALADNYNPDGDRYSPFLSRFYTKCVFTTFFKKIGTIEFFIEIAVGYECRCGSRSWFHQNRVLR